MKSCMHKLRHETSALFHIHLHIEIQSLTCVGRIVVHDKNKRAMALNPSGEEKLCLVTEVYRETTPG